MPTGPGIFVRRRAAGEERGALVDFRHNASGSETPRLGSVFALFHAERLRVNVLDDDHPDDGTTCGSSKILLVE